MWLSCLKNYPCKSFGLWLLQKSPDIDVCEEADTGRVGKQINSTLQDRVQENTAREPAFRIENLVKSTLEDPVKENTASIEKVTWFILICKAFK